MLPSSPGEELMRHVTAEQVPIIIAVLLTAFLEILFLGVVFRCYQYFVAKSASESAQRRMSVVGRRKSVVAILVKDAFAFYACIEVL